MKIRGCTANRALSSPASALIDSPRRLPDRLVFHTESSHTASSPEVQRKTLRYDWHNYAVDFVLLQWGCLISVNISQLVQQGECMESRSQARNTLLWISPPQFTLKYPSVCRGIVCKMMVKLLWRMQSEIFQSVPARPHRWRKWDLPTVLWISSQGSFILLFYSTDHTVSSESTSHPVIGDTAAEPSPHPHLPLPLIIQFRNIIRESSERYEFPSAVIIVFIGGILILCALSGTCALIKGRPVWVIKPNESPSPGVE